MLCESGLTQIVSIERAKQREGHQESHSNSSRTEKSSSVTSPLRQSIEVSQMLLAQKHKGGHREGQEDPYCRDSLRGGHRRKVLLATELLSCPSRSNLSCPHQHAGLIAVAPDPQRA